MCIRSILIMTLLIACAPNVIAQTQQPSDTPAAAPIPAPLMNAKKVFISNGAGDNDPTIVKYTDGPDGIYNQFYADIKSLGRYELLSSPADADIIFDISVTFAPSNGQFAYPKFRLEVRDAKTNVLLWTFSEPVQGAFFVKSGRKNIAQALSRLVDDLRKVTGNQ
jgi:hypothetical protein